jgi:AcrR family transcriptional regulator
METKNKITDAAEKLFFKYGITSISVDDITHELSISKKTFYENFANKSDLINQITMGFLRKIDKVLDDIENQEGIIDKIIALYTFLLELFKTCNASFIYDIKKYYPDIFKMFDEYKDNILKKLVIALINKGKKDEVFVDDFEPDIIFSMHWKRFNNIIERELLPQKKLFDPVFQKMIRSSLIGISTLKGHKIIDEKFNQLNKS